MINIKVIIPARYSSNRFPGKPLALIKNRSMIRRVWERCTEAVGENNVIVATDDQRIFDHCIAFGIQVKMTVKNVKTGTDRVFEVSNDLQCDYIMNVQGDEPMVNPTDIQKIISRQENFPNEVHCGMCEINNISDFCNPSIPKVVFSKHGILLYASRAAIPTDKKGGFKTAFKQVCIYSFPKWALRTFGTQPEKSPLEFIEDIEILRFLELGIPVRMTKVNMTIAVDYPKDITLVEDYCDE